MADDLDWDDEEFEVDTIGGKALAAANEARFIGEDDDVGEDVVDARKPPREPKKEKKKFDETKGAVPNDTPLDDPEQEKLRKARREEEADFQNTLDAFGGEDIAQKLESFLPKSEKDFEEFAMLIAGRFLAPNSKDKHYKHLLKHLFRNAVQRMPSQEVKDLETSIAGIRLQKAQEEKKIEKENAKKGGKKAALNVGKGGASAGLEDYIYDDALDDEYDFM